MQKELADKKRILNKKVRGDRNYKKLAYTRFFLCALAVLLQLLVYLLAFVLLGRSGWMINSVAGILGLVFVVSLFGKEDRPSAKLNWIFIILAFPVMGVPMYLLFGEGRPMKKLLKKIAEAKAENTQAFSGKEYSVPQPTGGVEHFLEKCGFFAYGDGDVVYFSTGKESFAAMKEEMRKAQKYILMEYFIIAGGKMWEETLDILLEKALSGVKIFILYDDFGSMLALPHRYDKYLEGLHENIRCVAFNRVRPVFSARVNNRDHRKMLVVDGKTAFTGGINIADEYIGEKERFGYWKDGTVKVTGHAVDAFVLAFFNLYNALRPKEEISQYLEQEKNAEKQGAGTGLIVPYDDMPGDSLQVAEAVYLDLIEGAKEYLYITTPYLVLDDFMRASLCRAALRGVDVRLVTPAIPDKKIVYRLTRANYEILMRSGVKIYEYTPGFIHAKNVVSDGRAIVGTVNFDYRSLYLHFENAVLFTCPSAVEAVKADCEEVFSVSKRCTLESVKRGFWGRLVDANLRVFETLM